MPQLPDNWIGSLLAVVVLLTVAWVADRLTSWVSRAVIRRIASRTRATWDDRLIERKVFSRLAHVVPGIIVYYGVSPTLGLTPAQVAAAETSLAFTAALAGRVALAFVVVAAAMSFSAFLNAVNDIYNDTFAEAKNRPIKGYLQVVGLVAWLGAGIIVVSILAERSPIVFLSGLGALTAVLLLVFRDTILSLVASLQIASNDMIRIGDWVEMPQANADGDVVDIALHTVKIQNWDKTISTIPTHHFISSSFKNWRGMSESGGRRIKRSLHLDMSSIRFLTDEEIETLSRFELLKAYMAGKRRELEEYQAAKRALDGETIPEPRRLTNVGTFRAYVFEYLKANPKIHDGMTRLVRQLAPSPQGLPIEIYCFTNDTAWSNYEAIQGDLFDHLIAILPEFGLEAFQEPAGSDFARLGTMRGGGEGAARG